MLRLAIVNELLGEYESEFPSENLALELPESPWKRDPIKGETIIIGAIDPCVVDDVYFYINGDMLIYLKLTSLSDKATVTCLREARRMGFVDWA